MEDAGLTSPDAHANHSFAGSLNLAVIAVITRQEISHRLSGVHGALVVDECHRAGSDQNSRALWEKKIASLGLSATPERQYDSGFEDRWFLHLGRSSISTMYEAVEDEVLGFNSNVRPFTKSRG